jgi:hypothetical protein
MLTGKLYTFQKNQKDVNGEKRQIRKYILKKEILKYTIVTKTAPLFLNCQRNIFTTMYVPLFKISNGIIDLWSYDAVLTSAQNIPLSGWGL